MPHFAHGHQLDEIHDRSGLKFQVHSSRFKVRERWRLNGVKILQPGKNDLKKHEKRKAANREP
jgi:hypothetical protein